MSIGRTVKAHDGGAIEDGGDDARLVALVLGGAGDAFDVLVRRYQRRAMAVAYRLLGNMDDAGEVVQESMLRAYRHLNRLTDRERFGAWLMRIVSNQSLNRRRSRGRKAVQLDSLAEMESTRAGAPAADRGGEMHEAHAATRKAIERLPEKQRDALVLFAIEGLPQKDVAEMLGCSVELVKWNVFQARKTLRDVLERFLPGDREET